MNLISIENLCVSYGAKSVLHAVDLRIDAEKSSQSSAQMDQARQASYAQ